MSAATRSMDTHLSEIQPPTGTSAQAGSRLISLVLIGGCTVISQLGSLAFGVSRSGQELLSVLIPSLLLISLLTVPSAAVGVFLGCRVGLGAPSLIALQQGMSGTRHKLYDDALLAAVLALGLGVMLLVLRALLEADLPPQLPEFGHRGVVGGLAVSLGAAVGEEVWFRFGLMTLLLWFVQRVTGVDPLRPAVAWPIVLIVALSFGAAHLPQLAAYGAATQFAMLATISGNVAVGILYGWCYWRRGLFAAITAHLVVDLVLHVIPAVVKLRY